MGNAHNIFVNFSFRNQLIEIFKFGKDRNKICEMIVSAKTLLKYKWL